MLEKPYFPWQEWLVIHAGELLPDGRPRFNFVLVLVARQNGKTEIPVMLIPYWMFLEYQPLILGTSTKVDYAKESWEKTLRLIERTPWLAQEMPANGVRRSNGENELVNNDDCRYKIAAANRAAGRSLTISRVILDELREHQTYDAHDAAVNATNAVPDAQVWALTNQGDEKGVVLDELRESALLWIQSLKEGKPEGDHRLGLFEWSAPLGSDVTDPAALRQANPSLGNTIMVDSIIGRAKRAKAAGGKQLAGFKTEVLCMRVRNLDPAISEEKWLKCKDETLPEGMEAHRGRVALCLDISMDEMHASLVAAARMADGRIRVAVAGAWSGANATAEARRELKTLARRVRPRVIGWFPNGPSAAVGSELLIYNSDRRRARKELGGATVTEIKSETTTVCMGLAEQVKSIEIAQNGDEMLLAHLCGAEKLWQADAWRFIRRGAGHCDGAYATAGAVHLARTLPVAPAPPMVVVPTGR